MTSRVRDLGRATLALAALAAAPAALAQEAPDMLTATLAAAPAAAYSTGEPLDEGDRELAAEVARRFPALRFSSNLARAARELGSTRAATNLTATPNGLIEFVLHAGGCPDPSALAAAVASTSDDTGPLWARLEACLRQGETPFTDVGVARLADPGGTYRWRWVVLLVQRRLALRPVPRAVAVGEAVTLLFTLEPGLRDPEVITVAPSGATRRTVARPDAGSWKATTAFDAEPGEHGVEVMAGDGYGPHVVALFPVSVGAEPPRVWQEDAAPSEAAIVTAADAERYLRALTDREREREGYAALVWDPVLAAVARAHAEDMRDHGFMGHVSPATGSVGDRLHRVSYAFSYAAENISRAASLWEAMNSLMRSPGHRRNLLSTEATRFGIGAAVVTGPGGERAWLVTQVFARPLPGETLPH